VRGRKRSARLPVILLSPPHSWLMPAPFSLTQITPQPSRVNPHLSLTHLQHLNLDFGSNLNEVAPAVTVNPFSFALTSNPLSFSRLLTRGPQPIEILEMSLNFNQVYKIYPFLHHALFPRLNPVRFSSFTVPNLSNPRAWIAAPPETPLLFQWDRIRCLFITGHLFYGEVVPESRVQVSLWPASIFAKVQELRLRLPSPLPSPDLGKRLATFGEMGVWECETVVLEVSSEKEKEELEDAVKSLTSPELREKFSVEVVI